MNIGELVSKYSSFSIYVICNNCKSSIYWTPEYTEIHRYSEGIGCGISQSRISPCGWTRIESAKVELIFPYTHIAMYIN